MLPDDIKTSLNLLKYTGKLPDSSDEMIQRVIKEAETIIRTLETQDKSEKMQIAAGLVMFILAWLLERSIPGAAKTIDDAFMAGYPTISVDNVGEVIAQIFPFIPLPILAFLTPTVLVSLLKIRIENPQEMNVWLQFLLKDGNLASHQVEALKPLADRIDQLLATKDES